MARLQSVTVLKSVIQDHSNLQESLSRFTEREDFSYISEICFGVSRNYHRLELILNYLVSKPLKSKDHDLILLLLIGLYELGYLSTPAFAAVDEAVKVTKKLKKKWASGLVNAALRRYIRERDQIENTLSNNPVFQFSHPKWLMNHIKDDYPLQYNAILGANNQRPKTVIRVNAKKIEREAYLKLLHEKGIAASAEKALSHAIILDDKTRVTELPYFDKGYCSVQDTAAQCSVALLSPEKNHNVLDACSAPGGKLTHILEQELYPDSVLALDNKESRIKKIHENLKRLDLSANVICGDAAKPESWWDGEAFDRILLDAPCSATGIIRRHPEIKILRTKEAIAEVCLIQQTLLNALWPLLKKAGILLYATCSILQKENDEQIDAFIQTHTDATVESIQLPFGHKTAFGWQLLPSETDGFYYSRLLKNQ